MITQMTYVVMADLLSLRDRAKGLAIISLVWLLGTVCGPVIGGGFTASVTWVRIFARLTNSKELRLTSEPSDGSFGSACLSRASASSSSPVSYTPLIRASIPLRP